WPSSMRCFSLALRALYDPLSNTTFLTSAISALRDIRTAPPRRHIGLHLALALAVGSVSESRFRPCCSTIPPPAPFPTLGTLPPRSSSRPYPFLPKRCYGSPRPVPPFCGSVSLICFRRS